MSEFQNLFIPLADYYRLPYPCGWKDVFHRDAPLELEIGFGYGEVLVRKAQENPGHNFIGIEQQWPRLFRAMKSIERIKKEQGLACVDAFFLCITNVRLGNFEGQKGETGPRLVKPAKELLRALTREEHAKGDLKILLVAQAFSLAMAIICAKEIFRQNAPDPLKEMIADGERAVDRVASNKWYAPNFIRCIQEGPWEV